MSNARQTVLILFTLATTAFAQEAPTVDELRVALQDPVKRSDALDEISRYWEGREELEDKVRALTLSDWRASWALGTKHQVSTESIDVLVRDASFRPAARWALAKIGAPALPAILRRLKEEPRDVRAMYTVLTRMGSEGRAAAPAIVADAIDGDRGARAALEAMAPVGAPLMEALIQYDAMEDVELLCFVGPHAFPRLRKLNSDFRIVMHLAHKPYGFDYFRSGEQDEETQACFMMLVMIGRGVHVPRLIELLPNEHAFSNLEMLDTNARQAEPALMGYLGTEHERTALGALSQIGVTHPESIQRLRKLVEARGSVFDKRDAIRALITGGVKGTNEMLAGWLNQEHIDTWARVEILEHLAAVRPDLLIPQLHSLARSQARTLGARADMLSLEWIPKTADPKRFLKRFAWLSHGDKEEVLDLALNAGIGAEHLVDAAQLVAANKTLELRLQAAVVLARAGQLPDEHRRWLVSTLR